MNHNAFPLWQVATTEQTTRVGTTSSQNNDGASISTLKYVTNARPNVKIISIASQGAMSSNDGTLLYGTSIDGSYMTVSKNQQSQQQQLPCRRPTANHGTMLNDSILLQTSDGREYLVDERSIQNIDQIPPENLIYMTSTDMLPSVSEVDKISHLPTACLSSVTDQNQLQLDGYVNSGPTAEAADQTPQLQAEYAEECQVTEEVITDDWVQSQGEECVQVTVDQLGVNTIAVEDEIPVPLDQDQYTLSRPYPCDFCSRRFRKKASLQNHLMAHSNDRPHMCNLCGAQYGRRSDLINHLKQHAYAGTEQDELSLRGDQDVDYDLSDLTNTAGHIKHRTRHSSEDEDLYIQDAMVSYNSQPPMQLISTTNYGASSATISSSYDQHDESVERTSYSNGTLGIDHHSTIDADYPSSTLSTTGTGKRMPRKKQIPPAEIRSARTTPAPATKASTQVRSTGSSRTNIPANRQIKKEPIENAELNAITAAPVGAFFPIVDERKPFVCQLCGISFGREKALLAHSRTHANRTRYDCDYCYAQFNELSQLEIHVNRAHEQTNNTEYSKSELVGNESKSNWVPDHEAYDHVSGGTSVDNRNRYNCDKCNAVFFQLDHLLNHTQLKHGATYTSVIDTSPRNVAVKQELVQTPSKSVDYGDDLEEEVTDQEIEEEDYGDLDYSIETYEHHSSDQETANATQNQPTALRCRECGETFDSGMKLLEHSESHNRYEPHECQLCGEKFLDETTIKQHVQERHRNELTVTSCAICGKRCKSQTTLMKHAWDHSRERTHSCSQCGKTFHHMTRLKRHMESHRNKTVRCEVCNQEFPDGRTLMNHRHSHTKSNEYPCHECGKTFGSRSSQQIHMRIHTGERPYACRFCWKAFADGGTLRKHERIHTGEKPYACPVCPKAFNQRVVLREHIRAHHSQADAKRGSPNQPYYCSVCSSPFSTTDDLVQHLIKHSDMNTAMKREPPTFPRKYKRRRKLKPHELERLQSGRRKQKNKPPEDIEDDDDDVDVDKTGCEESADRKETAKEHHGSKSSIVLSHPDGTLKTKRELNLEYGRRGELRGSKPSLASHSMLDENGINLLSNIVLLQGEQQDKRSNANSDKPARMLSKPPGPLGGNTKSKEKAGPSNSRTSATNAQKSKINPTRKKPSRKRTASFANKDSPDAVVKMKDGDDRSSPLSAGSTMTNVMEAFFRSRKRNSMLPEIPSHRISSVSFPLLDDGNTDDPMDEPMVDDGCRRSYVHPTQPRKSTASFSASEDDFNHQLLMEISHKNKYTERFNSDTVHDLEEILRSPVKNVPSRNVLSTPSTKHTNNRQQQQQEGGKPSIPRKQTTGQKGKSKAKNKKSVSGRQQQEPVEKKDPVKKVIQKTPPAVLRSQRLTRRQLEREVNFLKEAYEGSATATGLGKETDTPSGAQIVASEALTDAVNAVNETSNERMDSSERLAAMLLNDGLPPDDIQSSNGSGDSSCHGNIFHHEDAFASTKAYAESLHMMELAVVQKQEDTAAAMIQERIDEENDPDDSCLYMDKTTTTSQDTGTSGVGSDYRCSICAACFDDRAQLILHVPVHI